MEFNENHLNSRSIDNKEQQMQIIGNATEDKPQVQRIM